MAGNTRGIQSLKWIISDVRQKLSYPPSILRLDGGYLSKDTLSYIVEHHLYFCMAAREVANGVVRIRLNKSFPYQREVIDILNELRQQVQIEEVGSIICGAIRSDRWSAGSRGLPRAKQLT